MARTCLAENSKVGCDREVTRSPDFLSSGHPHAIYPADNRFFAHQDGVDHVIEELHVSPILFRPHAVILRILLSIATCAEGIGAGSSEYYGHNRAVRGGILETGNDALHHLC